jgi:16S rRNA (adenine1518-N6/adenine1519-N6)-dimethyltransferase
MEHEPRAKKSLGQHWLHDVDVLRAMCAGADVQAGDVVLEVGPGLGTLTAELLRLGAKVIAVEADQDLAANLARRVKGLVGPEKAENLEIIQADILKFDLSVLPAGYKVVANIPYYLTGQLLRILCEAPNHFSKTALLVQKEVAEKVCARPGDMSTLSVSVQYYTEASLGILVPAELFTPPPKVDSQILQLAYRAEPLFTGIDTKQFFRVVKAGFSQRRKTLLNTISGGLHISRVEAQHKIESAGLSPQARAQTLTLEEWRKLYDQLV